MQIGMGQIHGAALCRRNHRRVCRAVAGGRNCSLSRDDVLTLLIHLGYLTWDRKEEMARIPNEEIKAEFRKILKGRNVNRKWMKLPGCSEKLLADTIAGNGPAVAKAIEKIRDTQYAPTFYNKEVSTNNRCKFMASFIVFPGFSLDKLQRLFSDNS